MWSIIFFKWQSPAFAFVDILLMILFITLTIKSFYKISPVSASILLPYLLWVCFAAFLNYTIWNLNK
jgi:tryptophan-rich sensory protein